MTPRRTQLHSAALAIAIATASCATSAPVPATATAFPPEARRKSPPVGLDSTSLKAGALTSAVSIRDDVGRPKTLGGPGDASRLVLFYRGHW